MKKLLLLPLVMTISSCMPNLGVNQINNVREYPVKGESSSAKDASPIDSMYTHSDIAGCLGGILMSIPVGLAEGLIRILTGDKVDLVLSGELITLVRADVNDFIEQYKSITPDDFYAALSEPTIKRLEYELIHSHNGQTQTAYKMTKQKLAYAFLYFLDTKDETGSYRFRFNGRDEAITGDTYETISFNSSDKISDANDVGVCGYFRFYGVEVKMAFNNEVVCTHKNFEKKIHFSKLQNAYSLSIIDKNEEENHTLAFDDIETVEDDNDFKIKHSKGFFKYIKMELEIVKRYQYISNADTGESERVVYPNTAEYLDLNIKTGFLKDAKEYKKMRCREFGEFQF